MGVLQGATELLKTRPKLALELHIDLLPDAGSSAKEVWNFLQQNDMFKDRPITMLCRPDWDKVQSINSFQDLPDEGVVNLFVG